MTMTQTKRLKDKYLPLFLGLLFLAFTFSVNGQTYNPSTCCTVSNKAFGAAQAVTTDGRSWFYDATNFVMRDYNGTTEVFSYLNLAKYRSGHFPVYVHVGGILQTTGVWVGGSTLIYWFKDSTGNANLVRWYTDSTGIAGGPFFAVANNLSEGNAGLIKGNLALDMVNNTSDAQKNAATVSLTNHTINGSLNTLTSIPNSALSNSTIGLTVTSNAASDIGVITTPAALGSSLVVNMPNAGTGSRGPLTAANWNFFNGKLDSIRVSNDSVYNCVNGTCTLQSVIPGGGAVNSVNGTNSSLLFSPSTGNVLGQVNPAFAFNWTGQHTFTSLAPIFSTLTTNGGLFYGNGTGQLLQTGAGTSAQILQSNGGGAPTFFTPTSGTVIGWLGYTPLSGALASTHIFVGNGSNVATDVAVSGDIGLSNTGVATIQAHAVTLGKMATNTANSLLGYDGSGNAADVTVSTGLSLTGGVLTATATGTSLNFKGIAFGSSTNTIISDTSKFKFDSTGNGHTFHFVNAGAAPSGDITGFGNSITFGLNANPQATNNWGTRLSNVLGTTFNNQGLSSSTLEKQSPINPFGATNAVDRVAGSIPTKDATHRMLLIMYGINDVRYNGANYTTGNFVADFQTVINSIFAKGWVAAQLVLLSTSYVDSAGAFQSFGGNPIATYARQASFDSCIQVVANTNGIKFIDVRTPMIAAGGKTLLSSDGVHPNNAGHLFLGNYVGSILDTLRSTSNVRLAVNGKAQFNDINYQSPKLLRASAMPLAWDSAGNVGIGLNANYFGKGLFGGAIDADTSVLNVNGQIEGNTLLINGSIPVPTTGAAMQISKFSASPDYYISAESNWATSTGAPIHINGHGAGTVVIGTLGASPDATAALFTTGKTLLGGGLLVTGSTLPTGSGLGTQYVSGNAFLYNTGGGELTAQFNSGGFHVQNGSTDGVSGFYVHSVRSHFFNTVGIDTLPSATAHLSFGASTNLIASMRFGASSLVTAITDGNFSRVGNTYLVDNGSIRDTLAYQRDVRTAIASIPAIIAVNRISPIDSLAKNANGLQISGTNLVPQSADASFPGMIKASGSQTLGVTLTMPAPLLTSLSAPGANDSLLTVDPSTGQTHRTARITSGSYTSTFTNTTNLTSSGLLSAYYSRIGNMVHVSISGNVTPTLGSTTSVLTVSLPFTTGTTTQTYIGDGTVNVNGSAYVSGLVSVNAGTTATFTFLPGASVGTGGFRLSLDYTL